MYLEAPTSGSSIEKSPESEIWSLYFTKLSNYWLLNQTGLKFRISIFIFLQNLVMSLLVKGLTWFCSYNFNLSVCLSFWYCSCFLCNSRAKSNSLFCFSLNLNQKSTSFSFPWGFAFSCDRPLSPNPALFRGGWGISCFSNCLVFFIISVIFPGEQPFFKYDYPNSDRTPWISFLETLWFRWSL